MDTSTGHLINKEKWDELKSKGQAENYSPVPEPLKDEATKALNGKSETMIDLKGSSNLAQWAIDEQKKKDKAKVKRKAQKQSRKANRK